VNGYWFVTAAHTVVQYGLISVAALAYVAIVRDIAQELRGQ